MYYVYIIQSTDTYELYVGYTKDLKKRLVEHNTNKSFSTKNKGPWKLIYYESYRNKEDAIRREKNLKYHGQALARLKKRIIKSLLLAN
jgi:putative endonuclease